MLKLYLCMVENVTASRFHLFSAHAHTHNTKNSTINGNRNGSTTSSSSRRRTKKHKPATTTQLTQLIKCESRWVGVRSFGVFRLSTIVEFSLSMGFFLTTEKKLLPSYTTLATGVPRICSDKCTIKSDNDS